MAIFLKKFETMSQYNAYTADTENFILPNVSLITENNNVEYNPSTPPTPPTETRVVCKYNVEDTESETTLCYGTTNIGAMEIDGVELPTVVTAYTFSTTGEHTVKYTLTDPTTIISGVFYYCYSLTSIDIPNSVTSIGDEAFIGCYFETCIIGSGVTSIGRDAFYDNSYFESLIIKATTPPTFGSAFGGETTIPTIYVPSGSVDVYKASEDWSWYDIEPIQ